MSKPQTAEEFGIPADISRSTVEDTLLRLHERLGDNSGRIYFFANVAFSSLIYASDILTEFGIPVLVAKGYSRDEWSMVGVLATAKDGQSVIEKAEIWSPGV